MHELAIVQSIISIVNSESEKSGFDTVKEISLKIGEFSGIVPSCIREYFPIAAKGSKAEDAEILMEIIPAKFSCSDCGYEGAADRKDFCCPECRSTALKMISGREFFVESLKVE